MTVLDAVQRDRRTQLVEAGTRLIAAHGSGALTARRLAREVGTSTMAVYTHVGGMDELRRAIREDGYARLGAIWVGVAPTRDPVADLTAAAAGYAAFALSNANLYRAMFFEVPGTEGHTPPVAVAGQGAGVVERCMEAGRFDAGDPQAAMWQLWAGIHGVVAGALAGMVETAEIEDRMRALVVTLYVGFGDERVAAERSAARALRRRPQ